MIFVNGCFWHKHEGCRYFVVPKSNTEFWTNKINRNVERDNENISKLTSQGWNVIIVWECELKKDMIDLTFKNLIFEIENQTY